MYHRGGPMSSMGRFCSALLVQFVDALDTDASVMPDVVRAKTNVTTMMIAERAAEFIRDGR